MKKTLLSALILGLLAGSPVSAHEFWLWPSSFAPVVGDEVSLAMFVGEQFSGERIGVTADHAAALRVHRKGKVQELQARLPRHAALPELPLPVSHAGAHLIAFDSQPSTITLSADKFHAYLHDEGLDAVIRRREQAGAAGTPGRERYRRHVKTLLHAGGKSDAAYAVRTGQRLEILPLADPHAARAGDTLGFRLVFDDKPLGGALVKAWHKRGDQTLVIRTHSAPDGRTHITLPFAGPWMISVVHMIPAAGEGEVDWDSFWGNLTFALPPKGAR